MRVKAWIGKRAARILSIGLFLVLSAINCLPARAAEARTGITEIRLDISSGIVPGSSGGQVSVSSDGGNFRVGTVEVLNENDDWIGGMTPRISVELYADSGYYFAETGRDAFCFTGDAASYVTARRKDNKETLAVTIKLERLENGDLTLTGARWEEADGTAVWDHNPRARRYEVRLYRGNSSVTSTRTANDNHYHFGGSITRRGDYYFEVRAVGSGSEKGDWISSDSWYVSAEKADDLSDSYSYDGPGDGHYSDNRGPGVSDSSYYGGQSGGPGVRSSGGAGGSPGVITGLGNHWCLDQYGWWYQYADGRYPHSCWLCIDGKWYCFNESGYIRYGWIWNNQNWYYCGEDGALLANTRTPDGYYVGEGGIWIP